jgi:single-stranded-DNA-specific exonuclease
MPAATFAQGERKKRWVIRSVNLHSPDCTQLARSLKVSSLLAQVLINRGITDVQIGSSFLQPKLIHLISPDQMPGIKPAVNRIKQAVRGNEKITLYGDYDVDGITGVAILWQILRLLGANVDYYIPHRIEEGYGLNAEAVRLLANSGTKLLVTVDCGITALDAACVARELGLDLIVTDHHQPDPSAPEGPVAAAIVHPSLGKDYPNPDSAGAMVAFKLAWAVANEFNAAFGSPKAGRASKLEPTLREFMLSATSLAAMGTIADIVELRGENRILASYGLKGLPECNLCGIKALIESAGLSGKKLKGFDIGFRLAPILNAAGRMGHARLAVELLTSDNPARAAEIARYLKSQNSQRQQCERKIFKQACEMIAERGLNAPAQKGIVLASCDWHTGVIGVVASRIVERFCRPTIMINTTPTENGIAQGSGRSIPSFDLLGAIRACSEHLVGFGGHEMAAGITIRPEKIDRFTAEFETFAARGLTEDDITSKLYIDALAGLNELRKETISELELLGPFGQGNPEPVFATKGVRLAYPPRRVGANSEHLQLAITDNVTTVRCIGFQLAKLEKKLLDHESFNIAYQPQLNTYNGNTNVEFVVADIQFE